MKKIRKKHYISLAQAYVDQCKIYSEIEEFLGKRKILFCDEANKMMVCVENILRDLHPDLISALLDFAENGYLSFPEKELSTVEDIIKEVLNWKD